MEQTPRMQQHHRPTLQAQAEEWIQQRDRLASGRNQLLEQGGPMLTLKPQALLADELPPALQAEVIRQLGESSSS